VGSVGLAVHDTNQLAEELEPFNARGDQNEQLSAAPGAGRERVRGTRRHRDQVAFGGRDDTFAGQQVDAPVQDVAARASPS